MQGGIKRQKEKVGPLKVGEYVYLGVLLNEVKHLLN
jgi:hypothetical protein